MQRRSTLTLALVLAAVLPLLGTACTGTPSAAGPTGSPGGPSSRAVPVSSPEGPARQEGRTCPVTLSNGRTPPGEAPDANFLGNGALWTALPPFGVVVARHDDLTPDGSLEIKFPWWRAVRGELRIEGRRLDGPAPPLRSDFSSYGPTGFQASGVIFPTEGCWEVTGTAGNARLTFVVIVVRADRWALSPADIR